MILSATELKNMVAVITGSGQGIGLAIARRLAAAGASVVVCDVNGDAAAEACKSLTELGYNARSIDVDVSDRRQTDRMAEQIRRSYGRLDIVVNNAGLVRDSAVHKMSDDEWDLVHDVVSKGAFNVLRSCYPLLREPSVDGRHRKVVNISSVSGVYGRELSANYCAAKASLIGLTKAVSREWAGKQINVNAVAPGYIAGTALTTPSDDGRTSTKQDFLDKISRQVPIGRGGTPEDVASLVQYLAGSGSDYITGQVIEIHGGLEILRV